MASFTQLSDNAMNYYQFKAKQILLQKQEDKEWQDFCKKIAPDCAACLAEKVETNQSTDVGTQTLPKKPILRTDLTSLQSKYRNEENSVLNNIKIRLDKIDLAISKLIDESDAHEKIVQHSVPYEKKASISERSHMTVIPTFPSQQTQKTFEEYRKLEIQNAFKRSLQNSASVIHKKAPVSKPKHSSFFLPHDLEVKRTAARKAYLASLQTKPKVSFQSKKPPSSCEKAKNSQSKKNISARSKILPKHEKKKSKENIEETLIEASVADGAKDENIESVVDAILEDLLREAALELNRIRQKKREKYMQSEVLNNEEKTSISFNPSTSSSTKYDNSKSEANDNCSMQLKSYIDSFNALQKENSPRKKQVQLENKSTSTPSIEAAKVLDNKEKVPAPNIHRQQLPRLAPKFECAVKNVIKIDPETSKDIISKRDRFWRYLKRNAQVAKGDFNPWILNEMLAESILDDCITDIAEELSEMPSSIIKDLYNEEFIQQVDV